MSRPTAPAAQTAFAWADALLAGATTPWRVWSAQPAAHPATIAAATGLPYLPYLPGAQHLELLRRMNVAAEARHTRVAPEAALRVLRAGVPDRGQPDLPLAGVHEGAFGVAAVDPQALGPDPLLDVAVGVLAEALAALPAPEDGAVADTRRDRVRRRLRPAPLWAGDPWARATGLPRAAGGRARRAYVLAPDLASLAVRTWAARSLDGVGSDLAGWLRHRVTERRLPPGLDLVAAAERAAERVGRTRTTIVTEPALLRSALRPAPAPVQADVLDLARRVGRPLGVLVPQDRRRSLLRDRLVPSATARSTAAAPEVPSQHLGLLTEHAGRMADVLRRTGYPVLGSLEDLLPRPGSDSARTAGSESTLQLAISLLIDTKDGVW